MDLFEWKMRRICQNIWLTRSKSTDLPTYNISHLARSSLKIIALCVQKYLTYASQQQWEFRKNKPLQNELSLKRASHTSIVAVWIFFSLFISHLFIWFDLKYIMLDDVVNDYWRWWWNLLINNFLAQRPYFNAMESTHISFAHVSFIIMILVDLDFGVGC